MPSRQHEQRHDDAGTHSFILLLRRDYRGTQCSNSTSGPLASIFRAAGSVRTEPGLAGLWG